MLNIICWKWNAGRHSKKKIIYSARHVNVLYKSCLKFVDIPFKFTCITDNTKGLYKDIETVPVWNDYEKYGWCYRRLKTFSKEMIPILGERILSIDLDCLIMKNITSLIDNDEDFMIWKSNTPRSPFSGSMWMMNIGVYQDIWDDFKEKDLIKTKHAHYKYQNRHALNAGFNVGSDQSWLNYKLSNKNFKYWTADDGIHLFRNLFNKKSSSSNKFNESKIIFFSGASDPSQKNLQSKFPWIKKYWNILKSKPKKKKKMKIVTVQFDFRNDNYSRLSRAFRNSVNLQMPNIGLTEYIFNFNQKDCVIPKSASFMCNTFKLDKWVEILKNSNENICFSDCDMLMTGDISDVWEYDFDVACTYRETWKLSGRGIPFNGGVIFVRPNERSIKFFERLAEVNNQMLMDSDFHKKWRKKYAGMNQAAFGYLYEKERDICKLIELPCPIWNCVDESWMKFNKDVKMVHIKSKLRKYCLGHSKTPVPYSYLVNLWRWHETLDERKDDIIKETKNVEWTPNIPDEIGKPLTVIIPKLNDPHQEAKIKEWIQPSDQLLIFNNNKQNYRALIEKSINEDILLLNPMNYSILRNPEEINAFRTDDKFICNNIQNKSRSSVKINKTEVLNRKILPNNRFTFRSLLNDLWKSNIDWKSPYEPFNSSVKFDWKDFVTKNKIEHYCLSIVDNSEQYLIMETENGEKFCNI